jgi:hypothetical protein
MLSTMTETFESQPAQVLLQADDVPGCSSKASNVARDAGKTLYSRRDFSQGRAMSRTLTRQFSALLSPAATSGCAIMPARAWPAQRGEESAAALGLLQEEVFLQELSASHPARQCYS